MRPVGDRQVTRYEVAQVVAAEPLVIQSPDLRNLLSLTDDKFGEEILPSWDGSAGGGGYGGSRNVSLVPEPFIAA